MWWIVSCAIFFVHATVSDCCENYSLTEKEQFITIIKWIISCKQKVARIDDYYERSLCVELSFRRDVSLNTLIINDYDLTSRFIYKFTMFIINPMKTGR